MKLAPDVLARAEAIYERSKAEALTDSPPDMLIEQDFDCMWIRSRSVYRSSAIRQFIDETDSTLRTRDVACRVEWMRIDLEELWNQALSAAECGDDEGVEGYVTYTWECDSFLWSPCKPKAKGAARYYRCEVKPDA